VPPGRGAIRRRRQHGDYLGAALCVRPAAFAPGTDGVGTSRRQFRVSTVAGCWSAPRQGNFTLRGLVAELAERGLKGRLSGGLELRPRREAELQKKPSRNSIRLWA